MIELTEEQRRALADGPEGLVRCLDPQTQRQFVLVRAEWFDSLSGDVLTDEGLATRYGVDLMLVRSMRAYWRELPALLKSWWKRGKWVAYWGDFRVGVARDQQKLFRECRKQEAPLDQVYIGLIRPRNVPPWVQESMDGTLIEFDDEEECPQEPPAPGPA